MSLKSKGTRIGAALFALLFLATSVGFSIAVLIQSNKDQKKSASESPNNKIQNQEGKLKDTKLIGFTPVEKIDQLERVDLKAGNGQEVKPGQTITAHYTGAVASTGVIFQSSHDFGQAVSFSLSGVIKGWTDGVPGMKVGGTRRLLIPAALAYGATPPQGSGIPANADLVFDIELQSVN